MKYDQCGRHGTYPVVHGACPECADESREQVAALTRERNSLRAELDALKRQEPVAWMWEWFGDADEGPTRWHTSIRECRPYLGPDCGFEWRNLRPLYAAPTPAADAYEPMLLRDLARELGQDVPTLARALADLGTPSSTNSAVTVAQAKAMRERFPAADAEALREALRKLVALYVCNPDTPQEFIACYTPEKHQRGKSDAWKAWQTARAALAADAGRAPTGEPT